MNARPSRTQFVGWVLSFGVLMGLASRVSEPWLRPWVPVVGCLVLSLSWRVFNRSQIR